MVIAYNYILPGYVPCTDADDAGQPKNCLAIFAKCGYSFSCMRQKSSMFLPDTKVTANPVSKYFWASDLTNSAAGISGPGAKGAAGRGLSWEKKVQTLHKGRCGS